MKKNNNGTLILFAVLGIAGLYYLFSRKSEKQDDTYQVPIPSNEPFPSYKVPPYKSTTSYSDILVNKRKRYEELIEAGVDPLTLPIA